MNNAENTLAKSGVELLDKARRLFGMGHEGGRGRARGAHNSCYIGNPTRLTRNRMHASVGASPRQTDPLSVFLPDAQGDRKEADAGPRPSVPNVTLVVGQYGVGKTELIHQLGAEIDRVRARESRPLHILPVALADCRAEFDAWRDSPGSGPASRMLLGHLLSQDTAEEQLLWLKTSARAGEVIIALDAIDELVSEPAAYLDFLRALAEFVDEIIGVAGAAGAKLQLIVTTRLELLQSSGDSEGNKIVSQFQHLPSPFSVYFMRFEIMGESDALDYLETRLEELAIPSAPIIDLLTSHVEILRMLQRPLLARIFCDLCANTPDIQTILDKLHNQPNQTTLISIFVDTAIGDPGLIDEQKKIQSASWDRYILADRTAELYRNSRHGFGMDDIRLFIHLGADENPEEDEDTRYLSGLHKCPFLIVDLDQKRADFAHRIFEEYFTAVGLWRSQEKAGRSGGEGEEFPLFDEVVLNVDMRKLLKGIVVASRGGRDQAWYDETRRSYGLEELTAWENSSKKDLPVLDLEEVRCKILDIMTEADDRMRDHHKYITDFFQLTAKCFHPRYAIFNYEGISVYIFLFRYVNAESVIIRDEFSSHLERHLIKSFEKLEKNEDRRAYELLTERILSVALRLDYRWITTYINKFQKAETIRDEDVRNRIYATISQYALLH